MELLLIGREFEQGITPNDWNYGKSAQIIGVLKKESVERTLRF
jgi:hypothetical protein